MPINLPVLHAGQIDAFRIKARFKAIRCGRRWGKTQMGIAIACNAAAHGQSFGIFAPDYKILAETYNACAELLADHTLNSSKVEGVIRMVNRGRIDFWTLNNPRAGRSRKYHGLLIDEAAHAGPDMMDIWEKSIRPTLLDYAGYALVASTPNGLDPNNFFYRICTEPKFGFTEYHAPTRTNPFLPTDEIAKLERDNHPDVYRQEYLAEFVDWRGAAFFSEEKLLVDGNPVPIPARSEHVFAIIDTALKDGIQHDGTAVLYCARCKSGLVILDWDIIQIEADLLTQWLPGVYARLEEFAIATRAVYGSAGCWIEDKASGIALLQHAKRMGMQVEAIPPKLTSIGKEGRAVSVSGYVHRDMVKITEHAAQKTTVFRDQSRNHFLSQVCGFRLGSKTPHEMDLLDCFTYSLMIALGDADGW